MMLQRRGFLTGLAGIFAAGFAPAAVGSGILMPVRRLRNTLALSPMFDSKMPQFDNWGHALTICAGRTVYVSFGGGRPLGRQDGSDWDNAFPTVQAAASLVPHGTRILVRNTPLPGAIREFGTIAVD